MAQIEDVVVLNVKADDAVRTVQDLKDNIKAYKEFINTAEIGTQEYQEAVEGLTQSQLALKNAMNASTATLQEVIQDAKGAGTSYNALVSQMAQLKQAFRATSDEMERARLGREIKDINDQLKAMDAMQGNFQRNVGNYTQGVSDALKDLAKDMPSFFGAAKNGVKDVSDSLALLGKQPIMGLVLLLAPILTKIVEKLKDNKTALDAIKKVGDALEPVFDVLTKTVEWLANQISKAADWFVDLLNNSNGTFKAIISGAVGAGNAILQALLTPIRAAIEGIKGFGAAIGKVFKGDFKGARADAAEAGKGIGDAFRKGFSFESNFEKGKEVAAKFIDGLGSGGKKAKAAGTTAGKAFSEGFAEELQNINIDEIFARADKKRKELYAGLAKDGLDWLLPKQAIEDATVPLIEMTEEELAEIKAEDQALADLVQGAKDKAAAIKQIGQLSLSATADIMGSIADIYEANAKGSVEAEKKIKGLRIAAAMIQTIQGAIGAYMNAVSTYKVGGIAIGAIQAATVTAAGLANIAKMRSTSLDSSTTATASPSFSGGTSVSASPTAQPIASPTSLATLATDTQLLNQIGSQRVYILASDIEASNNARKVQVAETTF